MTTAPAKPASPPAPAAQPGVDRTGTRWHCAAIAGIALTIFLIRLAAPPNLLDQDQERPLSYVLDVLKNGNWLCQKDIIGDITSKPPVWTWLAAAFALPFDRVNLFALYLPGALGMTSAAFLVYFFGRKHFGPAAAFYGATALLLTTASFKAFGLARTDAVFASTVTLAALLAWRAWSGNGNWIWFWLAAAVSTLTKGPLGLVLASSGLLAGVWERVAAARGFQGEHWGTANRLSSRSRWIEHGLGVILFLVLTAGWFTLSYLELGPAVANKLLGKELALHAVTDNRNNFPGMLFYQPPLYYLGRAAPWSVLAYFGLWRVWKSPAGSTLERRFERFLFCWFCFGLGLFSLAPHQRADLLWPIMPAGALIAGRVLSEWISRFGRTGFRLAYAGAVIASLAGFGLYYLVYKARDPLVQRTVAVKRLAAELNRRFGPEFPLMHLDSSITFQGYLNTQRPYVSPERAAELLRGDVPVLLAVKNPARLEAARLAGDPPLHELAASGSTPGHIRIVSNQGAFPPPDRFAFDYRSWRLEVSGARLAGATDRELILQPVKVGAHVVLINGSATRQAFVLRVVGQYGPTRTTLQLDPAESRRIDLTSR